MQMAEEIKAKIAAYAEKLGGELTPRVKKRVLQSLGKLKKQLKDVEDAVGQQGRDTADDEDDDIDGCDARKKKRVEGPTSHPDISADGVVTGNRKKWKAKIKLLNMELATLAQKKQLKLAKKRFNWGINKGIHEFYDVHTYTNLLNCYVRCKDLVGATQLLNRMVEVGVTPNVVTYTALLKGYCEAGDIKKAKELLTNKLFEPNLRAINTFLRGCVRVGDAKSATELYKAYFGVEIPVLIPDASTFEYYCSLLCQSLYLNEAQEIIRLAETVYRETYDENNLLALASISISFAISLSILGCLNLSKEHVEKSKIYLDKSRNSQLHKRMNAKRHSNEETNSNEAKSLLLFQQHRRHEMELDIELLETYYHNNNASIEKFTSSEYLAMIDVLIQKFNKVYNFFTVDTGTSSGDVLKRLILSLNSFGLDNIKSSILSYYNSKSLDLSLLSRNIKMAKEVTVTNLIQSMAPDSSIDLKSISNLLHSNTTVIDAPIKLEICSGNGEWVVTQASNDKSSLWIGLELRSDRVYKTFAKNILENGLVNNNGRDNLMLLCGDASEIVPNHIPSESVSHIFINHPEPPERTSGEGDSQGNHLLTKDFFQKMHSVLVTNGNITIVTDNLPYATTLLESLRIILSKYIASESNWGFVSKMLAKDSDEADKRTLQVAEQLETEGRMLKLELWRGEAGRETGHIVNSSSYFDRMWNNGEKKRRYFICLQKYVKV